MAGPRVPQWTLAASAVARVMSATATVAVWRYRDDNLTATDRYVLLALADEADSQGYVDGRSRRSAGYIATKTHLSRRTVDRTLKRLIKLELMVLVTAPTRGGKAGGSPGDYHLRMVTVSDRDADRMDTETSRNGHDDHSVPDDASSIENPGSFPGTSDVSDAERLCDLLADLIEANGSKRPNVTQTWITEIDRMIRLDERPPDLIEKAIRWSQGHPFWASNIMSPQKLRKQFDTLRLQSINEKRRSTSTQPAAMGGLLELAREEHVG